MLANVQVSKVKAGKRERISFAKHKELEPLPYLIEIQKNSYNKFLNEGIGKILKEFSPISDYSNKADFHFLDYYFDGAPKYSESECILRKQTLSVPLKVKARLEVKESGQVIEEDVFLADIPVMNDSGTFISNGVKRVIKNQITRASGVYFDGNIDKTGKSLFTSKIMPHRGAWIELEQTGADIIKVIVDRQSKMSLGILLKSIGLGTDEEILKIFNDNELIKSTLDKEPQKNLEDVLLELARKLRPSDVPSIKMASKYINELFFQQARYDLKDFGRFKMDQKLSLANRIVGLTLACDVISPDGEVLAKKGEEVGKEQAIKIQNSGVNDVFVLTSENKEYKIIGNNRVNIYEYTGFTEKDLGFNAKLNAYLPELERIFAENKTKEKRIKAIKENMDNLYSYTLTIGDLIATVAYLLDLNEGIGKVDEIDHLGNRRIRPVGESMEQAFRTGVLKLKQHIQERMQLQTTFDAVTPSSLVSSRPINAALKDFIATGQLSQNMDDVNPLSTLTEKRRITSVGPGGLNKERAGAEVRDIHYTQYGRICPIETPEGENIGIVLSLAGNAKINEFGFLITPYVKFDKVNKKITNEVVYLSAYEEEGCCIAQANEPVDSEGHFINKFIPVRKGAGVVEVLASQVDYVDVSTKQFISAVVSLIPFIENDDTNRALMACSMQRQALPLIKTEAPMVATGMEKVIARDSGALVISNDDGVVSYVSADVVKVKTIEGNIVDYNLTKFEKTNSKTCLNQVPLVKKGEKVSKGDILADGYATNGGELALGKNILVAFMNWEGYNYEDAILINERISREDVFTSLYIMEVDTTATTTKLGDEEITRDIPNVSEEALKDLDENGIIRVGAHVVPGDILVGKVTPKGEMELSPEERLLRAIFGEKSREVRDTSLKVENGEGGIVVDVKVLSRKNKDELDNGVNTLVKIFIAQKRKLSVGDKMSGRHGNKGVVSRILPSNDMPFMANGQPVDIVLNPLGVPSRMNIGQILEVHLGLICKTLGINIETPCFNGANEEIIQNMFRDNNLPENGKMQLYDGRTGEPFMNEATVGYMYMLKLNHMVDSKVTARSTGTYALVTQQPLGGRANNGGQRLGEMEVWALEAYGAANLLQEMLTVKSDDQTGRFKMYESIVHGTPIGEPGIPEGFKVLIKEIQGLGLDLDVLTEDGETVNIEEISNLEDSTEVVKEQEKLTDVEVTESTTLVDNETPEDVLEDDLSTEDLFDTSLLDDILDDNE